MPTTPAPAVGTDRRPTLLLPVMHPSGPPVSPPSWVCHWSKWVTFRLEEQRDVEDYERYRWAVLSVPNVLADPTVPPTPGTYGVVSGVAPTRDLALLDLGRQARRTPGVYTGLVLAMADHGLDPLPSWFTGPGLPPFPTDPQAPTLSAGLRWPSGWRWTGAPIPPWPPGRPSTVAVGLWEQAVTELAPDPEGRADPDDPVDLAGVHEVLTTLDTTMAAPADVLELVPSREAVVRARSEAAALQDIRPAVVVLATMSDPAADPVRHAVYHRELDRLDARLAEIAAGIAARLAYLERAVDQ